MLVKIVSDRELTQGEDFTLQVRVLDEPAKTPHSFGSFQGATAFFTNEDSSQSAVACTGTNPETNMLSFDMPAALTAQILAQDTLDFEIQWDQDGLHKIEQVREQLVVNAQLF
jgi:hypothetical protein